MNIAELTQAFPHDHQVNNISELTAFINTPGLYAWVNSATGELWYIGKAVDLYDRLDGTHTQAATVLMKENKPYQIFLWTAYFEGIREERLESALLGLERFFISKFPTKWNKTHNPVESSAEKKTSGLDNSIANIREKLMSYPRGEVIYVSKFKNCSKDFRKLSYTEQITTLDVLSSQGVIHFSGGPKVVVLGDKKSKEEETMDSVIKLLSKTLGVGKRITFGELKRISTPFRKYQKQHGDTAAQDLFEKLQKFPGLVSNSPGTIELREEEEKNIVPQIGQ